MTIFVLLSIVALAGLLWLLWGLYQIGAVSRGAPIGPRSQEALLLVDLQEVFWCDGPYAEADKARVEACVLQEIERARASGAPVIALRQEWSLPATKVIARLVMKGQAIAGSPGTALATPFAGLVDHEVIKRVQDGFETGAPDALMAQHNIGALRIVGLDTNYCILKTALAARNRGYDVTLVLPGTLAAAPTEAAVAKMRSRGIILDAEPET